MVSGSIFRLFYLPRMFGQLRYSIKSFALDPYFSSANKLLIFPISLFLFYQTHSNYLSYLCLSSTQPILWQTPRYVSSLFFFLILTRSSDAFQQELNITPLFLASGHLLGPIRWDIQVQRPPKPFRAHVGSLVCLPAEWCSCYWHYVIRYARDHLFWPLNSMGNHRPHTILQQIQDPECMPHCPAHLSLASWPLTAWLAKNPDPTGTMEMRQVSSAFSFHGWAASNMVCCISPILNVSRN